MMLIVTESGTSYEFTGDKVRRVGDAAMRRDGEWLTVLSAGIPVPGECWAMCLQVVDDPVVMTFRNTTPVVSIEETP